MASGTQVLREQWAASNDKIRHIVDGLTDDEFFWEPCAGCWSVRRDSSGIYWEHAFGPRRRTFSDLAISGSAQEAVADLVASQEPITDTLARIGHDQFVPYRP